MCVRNPSRFIKIDKLRENEWKLSCRHSQIISIFLCVYLIYIYIYIYIHTHTHTDRQSVKRKMIENKALYFMVEWFQKMLEISVNT